MAAIQLVLTTVNINDVTKNEGDEGLTEYVFTVSFSGNASLPVTVAYATANATAVVAADYIATSGTLTFLPGGPTVQTITVQVVGDTIVEPDETFLLNIDVANARAIRSRAVGTILNDDVDLSVGDVTVVEGNAGTVNAVFAVSIIGVRHQTVTVDYATLDGTAQAPDDYSSRNGTVTLGINSTGFAVTVPVNGDSFDEADETFFVKLSNAAHAHLAKDTGVGTILDDDPLPGVYVNDVHVTANLDGTLVALFTVALDNRSGRNVSVHYVTHDDTAVAGVDYEPREDDLTFVPGVSTLQVAVPVTASSVYSADQRFFLDLSNPSNAKLADSHGIGTLIYADPPPTQFIIDDGDEGFGTSISGGWINQTNLIAYQLDHDYHAAGNGSGAATWTFDEIPAGTYQVFTRWTPFSNRATNAPYTVLDGGTTLGTVSVNQQLAPTGEQSNGIIWQSLGTFTTSTGTLRVRLNDNANGFVIADAVRIVADGIGQQVPEIDVAGFEHSIAAGGGSPVFDNGTEFGTVPTASNSVTHTFVISNSGNAALNMIGNPRVQISGADAQDFTVIEQPDASVAAGASTTFSVLFHPTAEGLRQATVLIESDDASEPSYTFTIEGTGGAPGPSQFTIDDTGSGFHQAGNWTSGTNTLANQGNMRTSGGGTGNDKAFWNFSGLAPGQYEVYATWIAFGNRATNAPFTVSNGDGESYTLLVNQQQPSGGTVGFNLGTIDVTTGNLAVTLSDGANGFVVADSVTIIRQGEAPVALPLPQLAQNGSSPLDVNADNRITALDALIVINALNSASVAHASAAAFSGGATTAAASSSDRSYFTDVNGDGRTAPLDALLVINYLNHPTAQTSAIAAAATQSAGGDSASQVPAVMAAVAVDQAIGQMSQSSASAGATGASSDSANDDQRGESHNAARREVRRGASRAGRICRLRRRSRRRVRIRAGSGRT